MGFDRRFGEFALPDVSAERLFGENMFAVFQRDADLFRMQGDGETITMASRSGFWHMAVKSVQRPGHPVRRRPL
jgi:hypothetical protein